MRDTARGPVICSTVSLFPKPLDDAFALVAEAGFDGIELMVTNDPDTQDAGRVRELSEDHELPVLAVHAPFLLVSRRAWGTDPVAKIDRAIELAVGVGARLVVVHPPYRWQRGYRRWLKEVLPGLTERAGVRVAVENMFPLRVRGRSVARLHAAHALDLDEIPDVVLDTSHLAVSGLDPVQALETVGDRLAHVHLSNNAGRGWDSHLPLDEGVLDLDAFLGALAERDFGGAVSLEIDLRRHLEDDRALRRTLIRNRERCQSGLRLPA